MKYAVAILTAAATGALAQSTWLNGTVFTTVVVDVLTTWCSEATVLTHKGNEYTVTEATTLIITDCPCTLTHAVLTPSTLLYTSCHPGPASTEIPPLPAASTPVNSPAVSYPTSTPTVKPHGGFATGTGVYPTRSAQFTGAASGNGASGLMVGAVAGLIGLAL